jgi:hypothetical protein
VDRSGLGNKFLMLVIERQIIVTQLEFHGASLSGLEMNAPEAL